MNDLCVRRDVGAAVGEADSFPRNAATQEPVRFPYRLADINSRFNKFAGDQMRFAIRVLRIDAKKATS
jgi:hypothetical protein